MKWEITYLQDAGIIYTIVSGAVTLEGIKEVSTERTGLARQKGANRFISDYRNVSKNISTLEIYNLPQTLRDNGMRAGDKIALIYSADSLDKSDFTFFGTRCYNTSLTNVKLFTDYDDAYNWITESISLQQ